MDIATGTDSKLDLGVGVLLPQAYGPEPPDGREFVAMPDGSLVAMPDGSLVTMPLP